MWTNTRTVNAEYWTIGETREEAETATHGIVTLLYTISIPVKRTHPNVLEPYWEDGRMVAFHTSWEADAWIKQRIQQEGQEQ